MIQAQNWPRQTLRFGLILTGLLLTMCARSAPLDLQPAPPLHAPVPVPALSQAVEFAAAPPLDAAPPLTHTETATEPPALVISAAVNVAPLPDSNLDTHPPISKTQPLTILQTILQQLELIVDVSSAISDTESAAGSREIPPQPQSPLAEPIASAPLPVPSNADGISRTVQVPILMYHYLSVPPVDADIYRQDLSVSPALFARQLDAMREAGYTTITLYDLVAHLSQGTPLVERPVILTFDDGYQDNYEFAFPLLHERGMTATFFVVTDFLDEERPGYLTWEMVRAMLAGNMSVESHGRNHISLKNKDADYLIWQALGSLETLEYETGRRPRFVSYPAGEFDALTQEIFASAGYLAGVTTIQGATHSSEDLFGLHRVRVRGSTEPAELLRLLALDW